jgi:hypothetical protein
MSTYSGPITINDGSNITSVDVANQKSFPKPNTITNHGYSTWYCFVTGTATYSIVDPNITIFENNAGTITTMVSPSSSPQRGTFTVTAGRTYYGNGPIYLVVEDQHHCLAPLSMAGTEFMWITARNNPGTVYIYAPTATTVYFYNNPTNGFNSTPTSTVNMAAGTSTTINLPDVVNYFLKSTEPVVATTTQVSGADKTILSPMSNIVYNRYLRDGKTSINTTPQLTSGNVVYDPVYTVMDTTIGDGAGLDCNQSLGFPYLSDTYSFGNSMSDFGIAAPYDNTIVVVSYWNGSAWVTLQTYTLTGGTPIVPTYIFRDGTNGPDVPGTIISGGAAFFASGATGPWRWSGNKPFYLNINDTADDEMSMLGWSSFLSDISGKGNSGVLTNNPTYNTLNNGYFDFAGSSGYVAFDTNLISSVELTVSMFVKVTSNPGNFRGFAGGNDAVNNDFTHGFNIDMAAASSASITNINIEGVGITYGNYLSSSIPFGQWFHLAVVHSASTSTLYINGVANVTQNRSAASAIAIKYLTIGARPVTGKSSGATYAFNGSVAQASLYTRALSNSEIIQNFNANRGRFGI